MRDRSGANKRSVRKQPASRLPSLVPLQRRHAWVLLNLLLLGFIVCIYLTYVHYRLHSNPGWRSACDIDPQLSCDAVVLSSYGSIRGTPLSILGAWFYLVGAAIVALTLRVPPCQFVRSPAVVLFIGGAFATLASLGLAAISIASIGSLCPLCVVVYAVNIGVAGITWRAVRRSGESITGAFRLERAYWRANRAVTVTASLASLAVLGAGVVVYSRSPGASSICNAAANAAASNHSLELIIYSDFQCPHCIDTARLLRPILREPKNGIRLVPGYYPLDTTCNPNLRRTRFPGSCRLALAAICANAQGKYVEFSDALYERAASDSVDDTAASLGLNAEAFASCLTSDNASRTLQTSIADAEARDVHSTPTLFLNGTRHVGRLDRVDLHCLGKAMRAR